VCVTTKQKDTSVLAKLKRFARRWLFKSQPVVVDDLTELEMNPYEEESDDENVHSSLVEVEDVMNFSSETIEEMTDVSR